MVMCVPVGQDLFVYNEDLAAYIVSVRPSANYGFNITTGEEAEPDAVQDLINKADSIEDRGLTEEEEAILNGLCLIHPEIRYIVESVGGGQHLITAGPLGDLFKDMLQLAIKGDPDKAKKKKSLQLFIKENFQVYKDLEKKMGKNQPFIDWLESSDSSKIRPEDLAALTKLLNVDPGYAKMFDFDHYTKENNPFENSEIKFKFKKITDAEDSWELPSVDAEKALYAVFKRIGLNSQGAKSIALEIDTDTTKEGEREVTVVGPFEKLAILMDKWDIKKTDLIDATKFIKVKLTDVKKAQPDPEDAPEEKAA